ncbi:MULTISPECIES: hypothetical protein [unclassified Bradyrhizobium]|uniref:hypothetical protein n=1 Tax=unclassified Bradyrhizobium TaxID=2631580 RepID=UPI002915F946|nr:MULTISPECIES: hypothetical protein [unclassified Bradyrhizobium]
MSKPALTIEPEFRSDLERDVAAKLAQAGVPFAFEGMHIHYTVPAREAKYLPDFHFDGCPIILEPKGRFGGNYAFAGRRMGGSKDAAVKERQKFVLLKEQHPEWDIRFIFSRAKTPIYPGSKTSYGKWATDHGFKWAEKHVPDEWIEEIKSYLKPNKRK